MRVKLYVVSLSIDYSKALIKTIDSVISFSRNNYLFDVNHIIVSPIKLSARLKKIRCGKNYSIKSIKDSKNGIYAAFNLALNHCENDGYIIFLSAGDFFNNRVILEKKLFNGANALISYSLKFIGKHNSFIFKPNKKIFLRNGLPHPSLFTHIKVLREIGGFPIDLGVSADFYATSKIYASGKPLVVRDTVITTFTGGGASSKLHTIYDYVKSLIRLGTPIWLLIYLALRKLISFMKYKCI
jgi:hypothetical protein